MQRKGKITVFQRDWPCVPCDRETCALSGGWRIECMALLTPEEANRNLALLLDGVLG